MKKLALTMVIAGLATFGAAMPANAEHWHGGHHGHGRGSGINFSFGFFDSGPRYCAPPPVIYYAPRPVYYYRPAYGYYAAPVYTY
jgi:hypothetical protein